MKYDYILYDRLAFEKLSGCSDEELYKYLIKRCSFMIECQTELIDRLIEDIKADVDNYGLGEKSVARGMAMVARVRLERRAAVRCRHDYAMKVGLEADYPLHDA